MAGQTVHRQHVFGYDAALDRWIPLAVDDTGALPISLGSVSIDKVRLWDGTDILVVNTDGSINVKDQIVETRLGPSTKGATVIKTGNVSGSAVYTPASGKKARLKWLGIFTPKANTNEVDVTVEFATSFPGLYRLPMQNPFAFAHGCNRLGAVDEAITVTVTGAAVGDKVYLMCDVEEE